MEPNIQIMIGSGAQLQVPGGHEWIQEQAISLPICGQENMDAIFEKTNPPELFSPKSGILVSRYIEARFDKGKIVIVPNIQAKLCTEKVLAWLKTKPKEFKTVIIDSNWELLDTQIHPHSAMKWKDINHKRLEFSHPLQERPVDFRPAARYLYFHYCMQVLRSAWQHQKDQTDVVQLFMDEMGKPFWGSLGRYMPRNMLKGLVEELGHEYKDIFHAASFSAFEAVEKDLLKLQAKLIISTQRNNEDDDDDDDDDQSSDDS
jgi:hypothetical protein